MRCAFPLLLAIFLVVFGSASCSQPVQPAIEVTPESSALVSGETVQLVVSRRFPNGPTEQMTDHVSYATSNRNIATVSNRGLVTAGIEPGTVAIRVTDLANDAIGTATLTVEEPRIAAIDVIPTPAVVLNPGEKRKFTASARLNNGTTRDVTNQVLWASSNVAAATVGVTPLDIGLVSAITHGETTITATDAITLVQGRSIVFVSGEAELVAIRVEPNPATLAAGTSAQLTATGVRADGSTTDLTKAVAWSTSAPQFATVDANGLVTGVASGMATLTAERVNPAMPTNIVRGSAAVTVTGP